jgi:ABC-type nitrate/sulfonate/bicarbonate transport system substrate-binding protein
LMVGGMTMDQADLLWAQQAKHMDIFGFKASLDPIPSATTALQQVALGQAHLTRASLLDILEILPRAPMLRVVGMTVAQNVWQVCTLAGKPLPDLAALAGKVVGVPAVAGIAAQHLTAALALAGIDTSKIDLPGVGGADDALDALKTGRVNALLAAPATLDRAKIKGLDLAGWPLHPHIALPAQMLVTQDQVIANRPRELAALLASLRRAVRDLHRAKPQPTVKLLAETYGLAGKRNIAWLTQAHAHNLQRWMSASAADSWLSWDAAQYDALIAQLVSRRVLSPETPTVWAKAQDGQFVEQSRLMLAAADEEVKRKTPTQKRRR